MQTSRRIPAQSIAGPDAQSTETLRLLFYLHEVERQAELFNHAFEEAVDSALTDNDCDATWRHLQSAMFAGTVVSRLLRYATDPKPDGWPGSKADGRRAAKAAAKWRIKRLRQLLALPEDENSTVFDWLPKLRNSWEHIDEQIDLALHNTDAASLSDWYLSDGRVLLPNESGGTANLRAFYPEAGLAMFHTTVIDLFRADLDMVRLRHNAREAQAELMATLRGRLTFGGGRLAQFSSAKADQVDRWRQDRSLLVEDLAPKANPDRRVRVWMQVERKEEPGDEDTE